MTNLSTTRILDPLVRSVRQLRWRDAALILAALFALGNWQLLTGRAIEKWDAFDLATPYYSLVSDFTRAGHLLYWNPWIAGGSPDFAIAGSGTFAPDFLLFAALTGPGGTGYQIYWLSIWLLGGMGMLLLARHLRAPVWGGLIVALGFTFSGFYTGHAEHSSLLYSYSVVPLIIWRLDVALVQRRFIPAIQTGAIWGLSALTGYPSFTVYTVALIVAWSAGRYFFANNPVDRTSWKHTLIAVVIVGAVGVAVLSPSYVSAVYEGRGYSDRSSHISRDWALDSNALHPGVLLSLGSPAYPELKCAQPGLWAYTDVSCLSIYTGAATLLLAGIGIWGREERRWRWFLCGVALFALGCAMSRVLPFRGWIYDLVPPTRYFRHSGMLRGYFLFLVSVLALFGARDLHRNGLPFATARRLATIALPFAAVAVAGYGFVAAFTPVGETNWPFAVAHLLAVWGGLVWLTLGTCKNPSALQPLLPALLTVVAVIDGLCTSQFGDATVIDKAPRPPLPKPASSSVALGPESFARAKGTGNANVNMISKIPTLHNYAPFRNEAQETIASVPLFSEMALGRNRIWFSEDAPEIAPSGNAFAHFANRMWELNAPILVRHSREMMLAADDGADDSAKIATLQPARRIPNRVTTYEPMKLVLDVAAPADGWVMISERWSRSWKAKVNGIAQPVSAGNFVFRALPVVKGINHLEFWFEPFALPGLIIVSWGTLGLTLLLTFATAFRRRKAAAVHVAAQAPIALPTHAIA